MRGTAVHALRCAIDLDRSAVDGEAGWNTEARSGRARESASQEESRKGARAGLHTEAGISGRSGGVRGPVKRWAEFPQPESVSGRHARGSCSAVHARGGRDLCAHSHCVFAGAADCGTLSAWRRVREAADGWRLASAKNSARTPRKRAEDRPPPLSTLRSFADEGLF